MQAAAAVAFSGDENTCMRNAKHNVSGDGDLFQTLTVHEYDVYREYTTLADS